MKLYFVKSHPTRFQILPGYLCSHPTALKDNTWLGILPSLTKVSVAATAAGPCLQKTEFGEVRGVKLLQ